MRLTESLMYDGYKMHDELRGNPAGQTTSRLIDDALRKKPVSIDISPVWKSVCGGIDLDYDCCTVPPFQYFVIEAKHPTGQNVALLVMAHTTEDANKPLIENMLKGASLTQNMDEIAEVTRRSWRESGLDPETVGVKFVMQCWVFMSQGPGPLSLTSHYQSYVNELGIPIANTMQALTVHGMEEHVLKDVFESLVLTINYCWTLMNCKNVKLLLTKQSRKERRWIKHHYDKPAITYRTLVLDPSKGPKKRPDDQDIPLWENRMHLVRGHMRDFRRKGLFGKYFGMYYCPSHLRGNPDKGAIKSNYEVQES